MYPEAVSPVPTERSYNGPTLERVSSVGEAPYGHPEPRLFANGNGYHEGSVDVASGATSPTPYSVNGYNGNGYMGYGENGSVFSANGNGYVDNGSSVSGYIGNKSLRRRLLPAIPKGEKQAIIPVLFSRRFLITFPTSRPQAGLQLPVSEAPEELG